MSSISQQHTNNMHPSEGLQFFVSFAKMHALISRKFDYMGSMLGFTDFLILYQLYAAADHKLRRTDLADRVGMTASGITRLLPPLEKLGLVGREANPRDARSSFVTLAPGGLRVFEESLDRAENVAANLLAGSNAKDVTKCAILLEDIKRNAA